MRIGIFTDSYKPYICGVTTSVYMLKKGLEAQGHEVYIICTKMTSKQAKTYKETEKNVIRIGGFKIWKKGLDQFRCSLFANIKYHSLKKYKFDIVHIHTEFTIGHLGLVYARKMNCPLIYTSHTMWEDYFHFVSKFLAKHARNQLMWGLKKLLNSYASQAKYTITPSKKTLTVLESYHLNTRYKVIPTGIELERFFKENVNLSKSLEIRRSLGIKDTDFCFLYLGRISMEKSIELLIDAFSMIKKIDVKFIIVGDGAYLPQLKKQAQNLKEENVIFVGGVSWDDVPLYYHLSDCFLNASITETQGLTYIEALASGLPTILRTDKALEGVVVDGYNGLLFSTTDELVNNMNKIVADDSLKLTLSKNAVKSVEKFSKECYTNNVLKLYEKVLNSKED